ncbi:MAG: helix-turn-helix transcriptional regulator [Lachnospiraceae bacterium]|nr:helix-turn-helix transcriptional regulator [Lachnospiraceae bacterium]
MDFNEKLICLRKQKGLSQEQLGDAIGVTRQTVSKWELGETTPDMDKLIALAGLFNTSIDELVGHKEEDLQEGTLCMRARRRNYEYKSKVSIFGIPLVHINIGLGMYKAKGIIAIGNMAFGVVSMGIISVGLLAFGSLALGLIAFAAMAAGILSFAGLSIGVVAFGGLAIGYLAVGGLSIGVYALGGAAIASRVAMGGYANGAIAIGASVKGEILFNIHVGGQGRAIRDAILERYPNTIDTIVKLFSGGHYVN